MSGAQSLRDLGHEVALIEVLDPFEIDPPELAAVVLEDEETGELVELPDTGARAAYLDEMRRRREQIEADAARLGAPVLRVTTQEPFDDLVARALAVGFMRTGAVS
jgi:uncharacterized protein (DUF58 family)